MRGHIKGGIWKNTEDEILKAAVMKYGKNQWARIASLLSRKSAKQCKARWYEWLDPDIKKTEWNREEEEKLLHLAKIMPCQWRTIAPIVGRTAAQCLEHYEKLLDAATQKDDYDPADDARRLRPGEIDPNPESKPARPDHVDMEEDEKEMLQEARARLANTKGKKAKRKARERQLEEARRLATLQKRRELKAAGISVHKRRKKHKGLDYNKEVPFLHLPAPGFHSISSEIQREIAEKADPNFNPVLLQKLEGERRDEKEERERKKDIDKLKEKFQKNAPEAVAQINRAIAIDSAKSRKKLVMPSAQLSDNEIREIAKLGYDPDQDMDDEGGATKELLSKYLPTPTPHQVAPAGSLTPMISDRTPARPDTILTEAQNLKALTEASTPLVGGENTPLHPSDFSGATPRHIGQHTPNSLSTPLRTPMTSIGHTPSSRSQLTPKRTPMRDQLNINEGDFDEEEQDNKQIDGVKSLLDGLSMLPKPREFKVTMPELVDEMETDDVEDSEKKERKGTSGMIPDAEETDAKIREKERALEDAQLRLRSQVLRRELPRPFRVNGAFAKTQKEIESLRQQKPDDLIEIADELIKAEMINMLTHDALEYPTKTVRPPQNFDSSNFHYDIFKEEELNKARKLLEDEVVVLAKQLGEVSLDKYIESWQRCHEDLIYLHRVKKFSLLSITKNDSDKVHFMQHQHETLKKDLDRQTKKANALIGPLQKYLGGYERVAATKEHDIHELRKKISEARVELSCFTSLRQNELKAITQRIEYWKQEVSKQQAIESELQTRFASLVSRKNELLQQRIQQNDPPNIIEQPPQQTPQPMEVS